MVKGKKQCPVCNVWINGSNAQLKQHMSSFPECRKKLLCCHGCQGRFVNKEHLANHQKQMNRAGHFCMQADEKLNHVQSLNLNSSFMNVTPTAKSRMFSVEQNFPTHSLSPYDNMIVDDNFDRNTSPTIMRQMKIASMNSKNSSSSYANKKRPQSMNYCNRDEPTTKLTRINNHSNLQYSKEVFVGTTNLGMQYCVPINASKSDHVYNINEDSDNEHPSNSIEDEYNFCFNLFDDDLNDNTIDNSTNSSATDEPTCNNNVTMNNESNSTAHSTGDDSRLASSSTLTRNPPSGNNSVTSDDTIHNDNVYENNNIDDLPLNEDNTNANANNTGNNQEEDVGITSQYINERVKFNLNHRNNSSFTYIDRAMIELYHQHRKSKSPIGLFDKTIDWLRKFSPHLVTSQYTTKNSSSSSSDIHLRSDIPKRKTFVKQMYRKIYGKDYEKIVRPKLISVPINQNEKVNATIFDFREVLIDMLSNDDIMNPNHLLFYDHLNPSKIHPASTTPVGEIVTSYTFFRAHKRLCKNDNDVLWPLIMYNDEINFDKYGKLKLDPFSVSFGRLPIHIRNQAFAWRYFGMIHSIKYYDSENKMDSKTKMKIYHMVLSRLFRSVKEIQEEGGIPFDLPMRDGSTKRVNLIIYTQFVVGDTKGHDYLCGRMGSHSLGMAQHVRDCCVVPNDSDNVWMKCQFRKLSDVTSLQDDEEFNRISFRNINNALYNLEMGDEVHGIFGATNGEPLHLLQMQLLELITIVFTESLYTKSLKQLEKSLRNVVNSVERQTIKSEYLCINAFREGLTKVKNLTGKERHSRLFALYLTLMCSDVVQFISRNPPKNDRRSVVGTDFVKVWFQLIESSLILMQWLKKEIFPRSDLYNEDWFNTWVADNIENNLPPGDDDDMCSESRAQRAMLRYLEKYKQIVVRNTGNELKIPKFHLMKHIIRNIVRNGSVLGIDTSRLEGIAKELGKDPGLQTQRHHKSITFQTACRYHENLTLCEAERLYYKRLAEVGIDTKGYQYFKPKDDIQMALEDNGHNFDENDEDINRKDNCMEGASFQLRLVLHNENNGVDQLIVRVINTTNSIKTRLDDNLLYCIANWLWCDPIGGTLSQQSTPTFFTELRKDGQRYRCHPSYRNNLSWNDWVYIDWGRDYVEPLPAQLQFFLCFKGCNILSEEESRRSNNNANTELTNGRLLPTSEREIQEDAATYLSKHPQWAVVRSCNHEGYVDNINNRMSEYHIKSKIAKRFKLEETGQYRIIPTEAIVGPAMAMLNCSMDNVPWDNTAFVVDDPKTWDEHFMSL